jgi:hypothetical protein
VVKRPDVAQRRTGHVHEFAGLDPIAVDIDAKHRITLKHSRNEVFNPIASIKCGRRWMTCATNFMAMAALCRRL